MKKIAVVMVLVIFAASSALAQDETTHKHSNGPRRQLATIVFAGLGGAILGLSTLSFYGRPQDHLANIAVGFAVGVIAGTTYVTFKTATTRDYYDDGTGNTQSSLFPAKAPPAKSEDDFEADEPKLIYGPLLTKVSPEHSAMGGQIAIRF